jgi:tripartite-type tricarboxylate transporter receptor subunit TctC
MPHLKSGRLKGIAVTGASRSPTLPELPSLSEAVPGFDVQPWQGLFGPPARPAELARKISADLGAVLRSPELGAKLSGAGDEPAPSSPEEFAAYVRRELERWTGASRAAGIQPE